MGQGAILTQTPDTGTQDAKRPTAAAHSDPDAAALAALAATVERARATAAELAALLALPDPEPPTLRRNGAASDFYAPNECPQHCVEVTV